MEGYRASATTADDAAPAADSGTASRSRPWARTAVVYALVAALLVTIGFFIGRPARSKDTRESSAQSEQSSASALDALKNETLRIPAPCSDFAFHKTPAETTFSDSQADEFPGHVDLKWAETIQSGSSSAILVVMTCAPSYQRARDVLVAYSPDLRLLSAYIPWQDGPGEVRAYYETLSIDHVDYLDPDALSVTISGLRTYTGRGPSNRSTKADAHVRLGWYGVIRPAQFIRYFSSAAVSESVDMDVIQKLYDAVALEDFTSTSSMILPDVLERIRTGCVGGRTCADSADSEANGVRIRQFPAGGTVASCMLAPPISNRLWAEVELVGDPQGRRIAPFLLGAADRRRLHLRSGPDDREGAARRPARRRAQHVVRHPK